MRKLVVLILFWLLCGGAQASDIHGVRSSFLLGDIWKDKLSTSLLYLSDSWSAEERKHHRDRLLNNGDTHIDLYAKATRGHLAGGTVNPDGDFLFRLRELRAEGLEPVLWLIPESKNGDHKASMAEHFAFIDRTVSSYDKEASAYVVCLECDEMFSPAEVNQMVRHIKSKTDRPIAVHLAPGVGGFKRDVSYYAEADYIYLQFGDHLSGDYVADTEMAVAMLKEAMKLGKPVVANEYSLYSESAQAKALGDRLCAEGAVGTGNGRNIVFCGQREDKVPKFEGSAALVIGGVAALIGLNVIMKNDWAQVGHEPDNGLGFRYTTDGSVILTRRWEF
jgi:hypothetical protein